MINYAISKRYAKVLFDLDCNKSNLEKRVKDFEFMVEVLRNNPLLVRFLKSPQIVFREKEKVLHDLFKEKFDKIFINFLSSLIHKGRLSNFGLIAKEYRWMVNEYLGIWEADIVTAIPMDDESEAKLKQKVEEDFNKKMILNKKIDPKIIGGVILVIANEMLDWSVTGRLRKLKEKLRI